MVKGIFKHPPATERMMRANGIQPNFQCFEYETSEEAFAAAQKHANVSGLPVIMVIGGSRWHFSPESPKK